jgi:hypothetical protein
MQRIAIVVPVALSAIGAAFLVAGQLTMGAAPEQRAEMPVVAAPAVEVVPPAPPPPILFEHPVGAYLERWGRDVALGTGDSPALIFMLGDGELRAGRHGWRVSRLAQDLLADLAALLDAGCEDGCSAGAQHAREAAHALADAEDTRETAPHARRWQTTDEDIPTDHRTVTMRRTAGGFVLDVTCRSKSWTVGMRMWNDLGSCDAVLSEHGRAIATYQPRVLLAPTKESTYVALDAYDQTVTLADHEQLVIRSGYEYSGGPDFRAVTDTPLQKGKPRGALLWNRD